jgi:hypothetical protein
MSDYKVIAENEQGYKLIQVGDIYVGGYLDKLIRVMKPDGTYESGQPVALQRFLKFSCKAIWRIPSSQERNQNGKKDETRTG